MNSVCVFLGSSPGRRPEYAEATVALGEAIARRGLTLVYGGSNVGLMKRLADSALAAGGAVVGILPGALEARELAHPGLTRLEIVPSMHVRKARMAELADAFIALPGGMGTLEELTEVLTWAQLGLHAKPCGLLDVAGYWAPLVAFLDHAEREGFVRAEHRALLARAERPEALLDLLAARVRPGALADLGRT